MKMNKALTGIQNHQEWQPRTTELPLAYINTHLLPAETSFEQHSLLKTSSLLRTCLKNIPIGST